MLPVVSISHLIALPFLLLITAKFYSSFQKTKNKNIGYFFATFSSLVLMEGLLLAPGLIFEDLTKIGLVFAIYPLFLFLALAFLSNIPLSLLKKGKSKKIFFSIILLIAFSVTLVNLLALEPAFVYYHHPFVYWEDARGAKMNFFIGLTSGVILVAIFFFFLLNGLKSSEKYVRIRSFLIAGGVVGFLLAGIINFVFGALSQLYVTSFLSTLLLIAGSLTILAGVYYKYKPQKNSYSLIKEERKEEPIIQW